MPVAYESSATLESATNLLTGVFPVNWTYDATPVGHYGAGSTRTYGSAGSSLYGSARSVTYGSTRTVTYP